MLPCQLRIRQVRKNVIVQGTATVSSEPSIVYHPIPELLHDLNYARAVSDFSRADGAKRRARVLNPPGYLYPGKRKH